jgi:hypothetical protein
VYAARVCAHHTLQRAHTDTTTTVSGGCIVICIVENRKSDDAADDARNSVHLPLHIPALQLLQQTTAAAASAGDDTTVVTHVESVHRRSCRNEVSDRKIELLMVIWLRAP